MSRRPGKNSHRALYLLAGIEDEWPADEKNAAALRNACAVDGTCPACGATPEVYRDRRIDGVFHLVFRHEGWCPASTDKGAVA